MAEKIFFVESASGTRKPLEKKEASALLFTGRYRKIINTKLMCVIRDLTERATSTPDPNYHLGGGRLRHPFGN